MTRCGVACPSHNVMDMPRRNDFHISWILTQLLSFICHNKRHFYLDQMLWITYHTKIFDWSETEYDCV